jgi:hypothetical protein
MPLLIQILTSILIATLDFKCTYVNDSTFKIIVVICEMLNIHHNNDMKPWKNATLMSWPKVL